MIQTAMLEPEHWKRGPGGHWYTYRAWDDNVIPAVMGYGQTALEATRDCEKKLAALPRPQALRRL